jgi:hypothetical protein
MVIVYKTAHSENNNWAKVEDVLQNVKTDGIIVSFCDLYFQQTKSAITKKWYGIIHNPFDWEKYACGDNKTLFENRLFLQSLKYCKILFVLSSTQIEPLKKMLSKKRINNIKVASLIHPINPLNFSFDHEKYKLNNNKTIFSVGNWLRKQYTIFKLVCDEKFSKSIIPFNKRTQFELDFYKKKDNVIISQEEEKNVKKIEHLDENDYHKIFESNLIFLDVYSTTIDNTFLECVISNTPIILNRHQEYINLIGGDYQLFFDNLEQVNSFIATDENILNAHNYLKNVDKTKFTMMYFLNSIQENIDSVL